MSGYSRRRVAHRHATEQKKASELEKGGCAQSELQHRPQALMCDLPKIQLLALSQSSCPSVAERFDELHPVPVGEKPVDPNHYKLLSKSDVQCISLDAYTVSISSDQTDCGIREIGAWSSENASTTKAGNSDGKNQNNFLSYDRTEESHLSNEPKLSVSTAVPTPTSTLQSCEDNTTKTDFIEIGASQTHSTLSSLQNNAGANSIQSEPNKLPKIRTRSFVYLKQKEIETLSKDSDVQRESSSSVSRSLVPSGNQSKSKPEQSIGNRLSSKEFCCVLSWLTCIYGKPLQCACTFPAGTAKPGQNYATVSSFSLSQLALEREPHKDVNNTTNTVQNGSTSTSQRCEEQTQNEQEIHTYILKESSEVGRRKSKTSELSEGENSQAKGTQEPVLNSFLQLKTLRTCNESTNLLDRQKKAQNADIQLCTGNEEEKNIPADSDILSISSNESDFDIMETGVSIPENVRQDLLPKQDISQFPMFKPKYVKSCTNANVSKADRSKNMLNNDGEKNSTLSEQNKLSVNIGGSFYVSPKQTGTLTGESIVHTQCSSSTHYQDTLPEPPKKNSESTFKVKDNIHNDCQDTTFIDEVVQDSQIEEQNPLRPENKCGSDDDKFENESAEARCVHDSVISVACNENLFEVREELSLTSSVEEIPEQSLASLAMSTEQQSQSLPIGDQEYQFNWTDQLSEIITQFPLGIHDVNTDKPSLDKETAVISQEGYSNEVIDRCLDNFEELIEQFDAKNASFLCNDRNNDELHCAKPSDNRSNDKKAEKVQKDTCNKQFCCMLSWSAYVCGEQSKCLCSFVSHVTNLGVDGEVCSQISHPSCKVNVPLIKKPKTNTEKKDTRTVGLRSRPQVKTQGNISEKYIPKNWKSKEYSSRNRLELGRKKRKRKNINLEGKCKSTSTAKNSRLHNTRIAKQLDRKKKDQQTNIQFHKGKAQPLPLSKMTDTAPGLVQCNSSLLHVDNTAAAENKPNTHVKKKRDSDICVFPKEASTALTSEVCCGLQAKSFPTVSQIVTATGQFNRFNKNTPVGKQDCSNQPSRKNKQNEHNQCTSPVEHEQNVLEKSTIHVQECSFLDRIRQLRQRIKMECKAELSGKVSEFSKTTLCSRSIWNTQHIEGLQFFPTKEDRIGYAEEAINCTPTIKNNLDLQSKMCSPGSHIVTGTNPSKNTCDGAIDVLEKASAVKLNISHHIQKLDQAELNDCGQLSNHKSKPTGKKTQYTKLCRPEPEVFIETIETLASPKLDVMKSNTDNKRGRSSKVSSKYVDNSQFYLRKVEQGSLIQLCKNPFVKLISSELCKDSSSPLSKKFGSFSSKQSFKIPSQMSEGWPQHPANQHHLPKDIVRSKRQKKKSGVPAHSSIGVCQEKSNHFLKVNISEHIISSENALQQVLSPTADVGDPLTCEKKKSDSEISVHGLHNLDVHIQEVKENQLKTCQKTQVSTKKSVTPIYTRGAFPDLETKTFSQLRKLDVEQELPKDNYSLVNQVNKNTSGFVKQNSTDLHLLPAVQKLTEEKHQEIVSEDRHDSTNKSKIQSQRKKQCFPTKAIRARSTSKRKLHSPGLDEQNNSVETSDAPSPSVCRLESSMNCDESKEGTEKDKQNACNLKRDQAVTKLIPDIFVHKRSTSRRSHLDLQTETVSHLDSEQKISKNDLCVVEGSNEEATPAMQKAKFSDKYKKCGQKLKYEHNLGHEGKKQTPRQRKRKTNNPGSERDSSKRRKSGVSNRKAVSDEKKPTCTREPSLNLEKTTRCLLTHINAATVSSICDISVSKEVIEASIPNQDFRCVNQPLNEKSQESSNLSNNHYLNSDSTKLNWKKQGMEADVLKDKLTTSLYRNQISCDPYVPLERIKTTVSSTLPALKKSTKKVGIEQDTKLTDNLNSPLENMASQRPDAAVKVPGASCCDRPTGQSSVQENTYVRQCVLKLCRLPLPLERQYLPDNTRETGKEHK